MPDVGVVASHTVLTPRLEVRLPVEADRERFVQLFRDERFMVFSGVLDVEGAHRRLDGMLAERQSLDSYDRRTDIWGTTSPAGGLTRLGD